MDDHENIAAPPTWVRKPHEAPVEEPQGAEPPQGANLVAQIEEWRQIMKKEQEDYETRRKDQDQRLERLIKMAELQSRPQELTVATPTKTIVEKGKENEEKEDEWQKPGACPWSPGPKTETGDKDKDPMDARMRRIEQFMLMQEQAWYGSEEPEAPGGGGPASSAAAPAAAESSDPGIKALLEVVQSLKKDIEDLKSGATAAATANANVAQNLMAGAEKPLPHMDRKLIPKPDRYTGTDVTKFPSWQEEFKAYLEHHDVRFGSILNKVEEYTTPIGSQEALNIALNAGVVQCKEDLDRNLVAYLKAFTSGEALKLTVKLGKEKVYETYRLLCEAGRSRRPEHVAAMRSRVQQPPRGVALASLMNAILDWEKDLDYVEKVHTSLGKPFNLDDEDRRLHLINMCPKDTSDYILRESIRFPTYATARSEIVEHIARSKRHIRGGVQALSQENGVNEPEDHIKTFEGFD